MNARTRQMVALAHSCDLLSFRVRWRFYITNECILVTGALIARDYNYFMRSNGSLDRRRWNNIAKIAALNVTELQTYEQSKRPISSGTSMSKSPSQMNRWVWSFVVAYIVYYYFGNFACELDLHLKCMSPAIASERTHVSGRIILYVLLYLPLDTDTARAMRQQRRRRRR